MVLVQQTYHTVAYAFLVTLVVLAISVVLQVSDAATSSAPLGSGWTAVLAGLGLHLLLTLVLVLKRLYVAVDTRSSTSQA